MRCLLGQDGTSTRLNYNFASATGVQGSTAFLQVPCHTALIKEFDSATHDWLVKTNWIRTICWCVSRIDLSRRTYYVPRLFLLDLDRLKNDARLRRTVKAVASIWVLIARVELLSQQVVAAG